MNVFAAPAGCSLQANFIQSIFAPINVLDSSFLGRSRLKGLSQESKCICVKTVNVFVSRVWMYLCSHQHWLAGLLWAAARSKIKSSIASLPPPATSYCPLLDDDDKDNELKFHRTAINSQCGWEVHSQWPLVIFTSRWTRYKSGSRQCRQQQLISSEGNAFLRWR